MSDLVRLSWDPGGIAVVAMEDRESKNRSSPAFDRAIATAFQTIAAEPSAKVVVIHGYDNFFCCGGSHDELRQLADGEAVFTDFIFYDEPLRCELPVIAAMQGHALGGGLAFGCFADLVVLAEESVYSANFMHLGFTPGVGATWSLPRKFGPTLGWEMMWTAASYRGIQLRERGVPVPVLKKTEVIPHALSLARDLAEMPIVSLKELKRHFVTSVRQELDNTIREELAMHQRIFTNPIIRERIENLYHP